MFQSHLVHKANVSIGSMIHMAGALAPLLIHEFVKDREKASRYVRISAAVTAIAGGMLWRDRVNVERLQSRSVDERTRA